MAELSTEHLTEMLEICEKAKAFSDAPQHLTRYDHGGGRLTRIHHTDTGTEYRTLVADFYEESDREFYATFDPATCAELINRLLVAEAEVGRLRKYVKDLEHDEVSKNGGRR
jgi:hypothetical protein